MRFSVILACAAAVATASPIALPSKLSSADTPQHEPIPDQLEKLTTLSDRVALELYRYQGGDFSSLESLLYEFSSATDELSFTAQDGKKVAKLDEGDTEDILDALPVTEPHFRAVMRALDAKKNYMTLEKKKVVANILYNTKVSIAMLVTGIKDITTRSEDITYLTKPYEDDVFETWRSFEKDANPEWYVPDQNQVSPGTTTSFNTW